MTMFRTPWIPLLTPMLFLTFACGDSGRDSDDAITFGDGGGLTLGNDGNDGSDGNDGNDDVDTGDDADPTDTNDDGGIKLDTLGGDEEGRSSADDGGSEQGCQAIDFLFLIDNSGSMGDNQANLVASFPGFIQKIQDTVANVDSYHVMVVKSDELWSGCSIECGIFPGLCTHGGIDGCNGAPSQCDDTLGAGVNYPFGDDASNQYCQLTGGQRYITPQEPFDLLPSKFDCIARVGTSGSGSEKQIEALTAALGSPINGAGGCNSGFLRNDAVLVLTIITDEEDTGSAGTPAEWYNKVVAQKAGDNSGVVVLSLINDTDAVAPVCPVDSQDPAKIREFAEKFPNRITGSVCEQNYAPFFDQAVDLINTTCDEFVPVG